MRIFPVQQNIFVVVGVVRSEECKEILKINFFDYVNLQALHNLLRASSWAVYDVATMLVVVED